MNYLFFINTILLGVALSMDAFSASLANGLSEQHMKKSKMLFISSMFAIFQAIMPLIGWICIHYLLSFFSIFEKFIPYIALALLLFLGIKMFLDGIKNKDEEQIKSITIKGIFLQAIATSIDALSVGFTFATYSFLMVLLSIFIIGIITFVLCFIGVVIGKKFGKSLSNKATILGGIILICIGIEIFISSII